MGRRRREKSNHVSEKGMFCGSGVCLCVCGTAVGVWVSSGVPD